MKEIIATIPKARRGFKGATGYWVRIRPYGQSHTAAEQIARIVQPEEGEAYLVRLD